MLHLYIMFEDSEYYFIELGDTVKVIDVDVSCYNKSPLRYRKGFYCEYENEKCSYLIPELMQLMFDKTLNICCPCRILLEERLDKKRLLHNGIKYNRRQQKIIYK